jgi:hypothetical protein
VKRGNYDHERAVIAWNHLVDYAAKAYYQEFGGGSSWHAIFPKSERMKLARHYAIHFERDADSPIRQALAKHVQSPSELRAQVARGEHGAKEVLQDWHAERGLSTKSASIWDQKNTTRGGRAKRTRSRAGKTCICRYEAVG